MTTIAHLHYPSPVGRLKLVASQHGLMAILWENDAPKRVRLGESVEDANRAATG